MFRRRIESFCFFFSRFPFFPLVYTNPNSDSDGWFTICCSCCSLDLLENRTRREFESTLMMGGKSLKVTLRNSIYWNGCHVTSKMDQIYKSPHFNTTHSHSTGDCGIKGRRRIKKTWNPARTYSRFIIRMITSKSRLLGPCLLWLFVFFLIFLDLVQFHLSILLFFRWIQLPINTLLDTKVDLLKQMSNSFSKWSVRNEVRVYRFQRLKRKLLCVPNENVKLKALTTHHWVFGCLGGFWLLRFDFYYRFVHITIILFGYFLVVFSTLHYFYEMCRFFTSI